MMKSWIVSAWRQVTIETAPLLLLGTALNLGIACTSAAAQVNETQVNALVEALRLAAPPDSPNDGMYSDWQVLAGTIPGWTEECVGKSVTPEQFEADAEMARSVVSCIVQWQLDQQWDAAGTDEQKAIRGAACWWMTGDANGCQSGDTAQYVQRVWEFYGNSN